MKALVYLGNGSVAVQDIPKPTLRSPTDAILRITKTTICGTDLHIKKGDVPACQPGLVLGHEGVGIVDAVGSAVTRFRPGDHVMIICVTQCGMCPYCRRGMMSHCETGGWILGKMHHGTQAEYVCVPHADTSLLMMPEGADPEDMVMAGPIGLGALMCAQMYSPAKIIMVDQDDGRLAMAAKMGANAVVNSGKEDAVQRVLELTNGIGCDSVIEAVGVPATFELCQKLLAPGGTLANMGVHGKPVTLDLEALWDRNITITTRLLDTVTTPMVAKLVASGQLDAKKLITHRFKASEMEKAYETFGNAAQHGALKVLIDME
ncbi:hypothetical protein TD95_002892 [Thielaviopsis punctulata]|uniref:Enoyl reductase (ER) domain-containing protein n=1 Tax=Thielaviopsis punctulata TaxID=72032 RepID=A0A0F4ZEH5_9PEZI|nr:hypothetical protein TD95_002892 [Thielaviopsis punctulata]